MLYIPYIGKLEDQFTSTQVHPQHFPCSAPSFARPGVAASEVFGTFRAELWLSSLFPCLRWDGRSAERGRRLDFGSLGPRGVGGGEPIPPNLISISFLSVIASTACHLYGLSRGAILCSRLALQLIRLRPQVRGLLHLADMRSGFRADFWAFPT